MPRLRPSIGAGYTSAVTGDRLAVSCAVFSSASPHFGIAGDTEQERIAGTARISDPRFLFLAQIARSVWPRLSSELAARDGCEGSRCPARIRRDFVNTAVREFDPH